MDRTNAPGHVNHLFVAEDPATNRPPTEITAQDLNAHQEELINIILAAQMAPDGANNAQVIAALNAMFAKISGATGLIRTLTPAGGARIRELGDIANAATVGGIEFGISYNCNIDPVTGVWAGRDVADICWLEKWTDAGGVKEFWVAPTAAAGANPAWTLALSINTVSGDMGGSMFITPTNDPTYANNSSKPASTSWIRGAMSAIATAAGFSYSFTTNGYFKFPTWLAGFIIQWGQVAGGNGVTNIVTLPIAFPNSIFGLYGNVGASVGTDFVVRSITLASLGLAQIQFNATPATTNLCVWFAIGR